MKLYLAAVLCLTMLVAVTWAAPGKGIMVVAVVAAAVATVAAAVATVAAAVVVVELDGAIIAEATAAVAATSVIEMVTV